MKAIKLKCQTLGRKFGDVIKIGKKDDEISEKEATALVADGFAFELVEEVVTSADELKKENKALSASVEPLKAQVETLTKENTDLKAEIEALKATIEAPKDGKK